MAFRGARFTCGRCQVSQEITKSFINCARHCTLPPSQSCPAHVTMLAMMGVYHGRVTQCRLDHQEPTRKGRARIKELGFDALKLTALVLAQAGSQPIGVPYPDGDPDVADGQNQGRAIFEGQNLACLVPRSSVTYWCRRHDARFIRDRRSQFV